MKSENKDFTHHLLVAPNSRRMSPNGHACRIRSPDLYHFDKEVKRGSIKRGTYCKIDKLNNVFPSAGHKCEKGSFNRVRPQIEREIENNF